MGSSIRVRGFGPLTFFKDGDELELPMASRAVLAALVAAGPAGLTGDRLLDDLRTAAPLKSGSLRTRLSRLRRSVGADAFGHSNGRYRLLVECESVDVWDFVERTERTERTERPESIELFNTLNKWVGSPLADIPVTEGIRAYQALLTQRRVESLLSLVSAGFEHPMLAGLLAKCLEDAPYDESLAVAAANSLAQTGRVAEGLNVLNRLRSNLATELGIEPCAETVRAQLGILAHSHEQLPGPAPAGGCTDPVLIGRRDVIATLLDAVVESRLDGLFLALRGEAGIGKSTVILKLQLLAERADMAMRIGWCREGESSPFEAMLAAVPELADKLPILAEASEPAVGRLRLYRAAALLLQQIAAERPTIVVVEDLHWADSQTLTLLRFLHSTGVPANLVVLVTARPAEGESNLDRVSLSGESVIDLKRFTLEEVSTVVDYLHARIPIVGRRRFSRWVYERSGGLPLVALALIENAPAGLTIPVRDRTDTVERSYRRSILGQLSRKAQVSLSLASVIGFEFGLKELLTLTEQNEMTVLGHIGEAVRAGLLVELGKPDQFRFDHQITALAVEGMLTEAHRRRLFAKLAVSASPTSPQLLRYVVGARELVDPLPAALRLLALAETLMAGLGFSEARQTLEVCMSLLPEGNAHARCIATIHSANCASHLNLIDEAIDTRADAFLQAEALKDFSLMAQASLEGLPNAVRTLADPARLELFARIPIGELPADLADQVVVNWMRSLRVAGRFREAQTLGHRHPSDSASHGIEMLLVDSSLELDRPSLKTFERLLKTNTDRALAPSLERWVLWASLIEQDAEAGSSQFDRVDAIVTEGGDLRDLWAMRSLEVALVSAGIRSTKATASAALVAGLDMGIPDAEEAHLVQFGMELWIAGEFETALGLLDQAKGSMMWNTGWEAFVSLCAASIGDLERAQRSARWVVENLEDEAQREWVFVAAAFLAETAFILSDNGAANAAGRVIRPVSGMAILLGPGTAYLGPADRYLSLATAVVDSDRALELNLSAVKQAAATGATVWEEWARNDHAAIKAGTKVKGGRS